MFITSSQSSAKSMGFSESIKSNHASKMCLFGCAIALQNSQALSILQLRVGIHYICRGKRGEERSERVHRQRDGDSERRMALEQTLVSTRNFVFSVSVRRKPPNNIQIPALSPSQNPLTKQAWFISHRQPLKLRLRCSVDYKDHQYSSQASYPKPPEIPWNKELTNTVHLIGVVGTPIETKHLPSGKVLAWTRLAVRKSATQTSWYFDS